MDINSSLQPVVASLIDSLKSSIEGELRNQINDEVIKRIASVEVGTIVNDLVRQEISAKVEQFNFANASSEQLSIMVAKLTDQINSTLTASANTQINSYISQKVAAMDFNQIVEDLVTRKLTTMLDVRNFPSQSIPQTAIDFSGLILRGDHIKGGIIENFGSAGIEDRASKVAMTLMDHATAFEGPVWAPEVKVKGDVTVSGKLTVNSIDTTTPAFTQIVDASSLAVKEQLNDDLFSGFSNTVFSKIQREGIELDRITQGGKDIIKGNQLGYHISDSNLQRLGLVRDLQTQGEAYLCQTLYVTNGRVGVGTMEPSSALSVWDEEVEINVGKRGQDTATVNTPRHQRLILGANGKQNIILNTDGTVEVDSITIGTVIMTSAITIPNYSGITGQIVWNQAPAPGSAIGWVCLGGHLWAKFGMVE